MAQSKLELILELRNKLFNKALVSTKKLHNNAVSKMRTGITRLKASHVAAFSAMRDQFPLVGRGLDLLKNKYALMAVGVAGLALILNVATKKAISFNHEFLQIEQLNLDKTKEQLSSYKDAVRDTAFDVGLNLDRTAQAYFDVQSATGLFGKEVTSIVKEVGKFSVATGAELNDSINATTKAMKAFGLGAKDIKGLLESNAKTVQVGITTFKDLAKVQTEYAGSVAGAGQSVDTGNKIFTVFTSIAKDSAQAATLAKTAFQGLTQDATIKGLKSIGVSIHDSQGNIRDLSKILTDVDSKFKKLSPKQIDQVINKIGGPEGLRALFTKLKTGADDFFKTLTDFDNSQFDIDKALKNAQQDVTILTNLVKNRWGVVMENLGQKVLPFVAQALNTINNLLVNGSTFYNQNAEVINTVVVVVGSAIAAWKAWTVAQYAINLAMTLNPVGAIIVGVVALIALIVQIVRKYDDWGASMTFLLGPIGAVINVIMSLKRHWESIKEAFSTGGIIAGLKRIGLVMLDALLMPLQQLLKLASKLPGIGDLAGKGAAKIEALRGRLNLLPQDEKEVEEQSNNNSLIPSAASPVIPNQLGGRGSGNATNAANDITKVVGAGQAVKNITINIDALNKGGINTSNTTLSKMSAEDIEKWFNDMMLKMVRNVELSI